MTKRIGHSLGWLFAAAILAVGPSVAAGHRAPTAQSSGSGGGGNSGCNDNSPPSFSWGNGWWGRDNQGAYWNGWGTATAPSTGTPTTAAAAGTPSRAWSAALPRRARWPASWWR